MSSIQILPTRSGECTDREFRRFKEQALDTVNRVLRVARMYMSQDNGPEDQYDETKGRVQTYMGEMEFTPGKAFIPAADVTDLAKVKVEGVEYLLLTQNAASQVQFYEKDGVQIFRDSSLGYGENSVDCREVRLNPATGTLTYSEDTEYRELPKAPFILD